MVATRDELTLAIMVVIQTCAVISLLTCLLLLVIGFHSKLMENGNYIVALVLAITVVIIVAVASCINPDSRNYLYHCW